MTQITVDLRSDTVTLPTGEMKEAMVSAALGDDVYGEDPTVNRLQEKAAALMGKEGALFLPSGTMGNLVALLTHTRPGDEVFVEQDAHVYYYEVGGMARVAGVMPHPLSGVRGHLTGEILENALRSRDIHFPEPSLVCLENTHNRAGGTVMPLAQLEEVSRVARRTGLKLHMDGARIFNAAVALGVEAKEIACHVDSVMFSISKGLAAPVGSLLTGTEEFIARARKMRKLVGGGMRQAGVLAAAGLVALEGIEERLLRDHLLARELACGLSKIPGIFIDPFQVETNIAVFDLNRKLGSAGQLVNKIREKGILSSAFGPQTIRFVTHYQIKPEDVAWTVKAVRQVVEEIAC